MGSFEKLKEAKELFDQGILSEAEFQKLKDHLLSNLDQENTVEPAKPEVVTATNTSNVNGDEGATTGMKVLSFLIPLIGLVLFIVDRDKKPAAAHDELVWAGIGFGVGFVLYLISVSLTASTFY